MEHSLVMAACISNLFAISMLIGMRPPSLLLNASQTHQARAWPKNEMIGHLAIAPLLPRTNWKTVINSNATD